MNAEFFDLRKFEKKKDMENGGISSTDTGNGGEDVYSSKESNAFSADHLVVMVHGILGR